MKKLNKTIKTNAGMTYVELIVVLSIFSVMTSITLFNYGKFQEKVDIKNLSNDIALKIVEAQKSALSGQLPLQSYGPGWKPSYGVYFDLSSSGGNKSFAFFTDLDQSRDYTDSSFCSSPGGGECLEKINITKENHISDITVFYQDGTSAPVLANLSLTFTRPDSSVIVSSSGTALFNVSYVQITIASPSLITARIKAYSSGRIQIN